MLVTYNSKQYNTSQYNSSTGTFTLNLSDIQASSDSLFESTDVKTVTLTETVLPNDWITITPKPSNIWTNQDGQ